MYRIFTYKSGGADLKKNVILSSLVISILAILVVPIAHAAEIDPAPGTYSYGSTSEFSPYAQLTGGPGPTPPGPTPESGLAPTGQNLWLLYVIAILAIATPLTYFGVKKIRKQQ